MSDDAPAFRLGRLKGDWVIVTRTADGRRQRHRLDATNAAEARHAAPGFYAELTRPRGKAVSELWQAYLQAKAGKAILTTMPACWKALQPRFGAMDAEKITIEDCRAHVLERRNAGIKDGTIYTELGRLRNVLSWAVKMGHIAKAPYIERPPAPPPRADYLTMAQARALTAAAALPHVKLYIVLGLTTGARNAALLGLTWNRVDFERGLIHFRDPAMVGAHKGRATVPINRTLRAALQEARPQAQSNHVIEYGGKPVLSVRRGLDTAARVAGVGEVSPHMLRHSAAVHMAEDGVPMAEIAQFLGHSNTRMTEAVYARFSPTYLRKAAESLEYDEVSEMKRRRDDQVYRGDVNNGGDYPNLEAGGL